MDVNYRTIIVPKVVAEIQRICAYVEAQSVRSAEIVTYSLLDAIESLSILPHRSRVHERRQDPNLTVYATVVRPYISEIQRVVRVLSVWHGARRQPKRFR